MDTTPTDAAAQRFIERWRGVPQLPGATELATAQSFVRELCDLLGLPQPHPTPEQDYQFERPVTFAHGDGSTSPGRIDCYRRGAFVLEAKKLRAAEGKGFDDALLRARSQAEQYARALPAEEGRPPFLLVVDVGRVIEVYAEFSRSGATYTPFPDPRSHRLRLEDLARAEVRQRLAAIWLDPASLDPAKRSARVTRALAEKLAVVARALETRHPPQMVADFLSRCLFSLFAEDIGLLPKRSFGHLLETHRARPAVLARMMEELWTAMDTGGFSAALAEDVLRFNGKFFKDRRALELRDEEIEQLIAAARSDWREVEPAIFGTLLERALDPAERHALGAHYTPRAYVERLVLPTVIEPLRADWANAHAAALVLAQEGKLEAAADTVRGFLHLLTHVRVLDPACGSANFLYVTLEHLKRLEGEVLNVLGELGDTRGRLELESASVDPHQLLGIELNPRAAAIAEMVLWIGYLQWHFRVRGNVQPPLPVLKDFHNIENRDAVLAWDEVEPATDQAGRILTRWDGTTTKPHPVTGEPVPDEAAQVVVEKFINPRKAEWPEADFVVGNPPFIGASTMRGTLGDGYVEALRRTWPTVPESADFVMYWWEHAAELTRAGKLRRFGFITTNSLRQTFNRRVVARHLEAQPPLALRFAIPDHPWVDSADGAAVRIAMTVADTGTEPGELRLVREEAPAADGEVAVSLDESAGLIHADLRVGANVASAVPLSANVGISSRGMSLHGAGFIVSPEVAAGLGLGSVPGLERHIRLYRNGRDLTDKPRGVYVIDFFGLSDLEVRAQFPLAYQWLQEHVKPERDAKGHSKDGAGYARLWWLHGKPRSELRKALAGLARFITTVETAKHRLFVFLDAEVLPDNKLVNIALSDAFALGVLSSRLHVAWALASGSRLGVGNDPVYVKTRCFETFPFPDPSPELAERIRALAESIDAHRKRQQAAHPTLTLTGLYNVIEKLRAGEALTAKERAIHEAGLAGVLKELHDELDAAVLAAYGWSDLAPQLVGAPGATSPLPDKPAPQAAAEEELLSRLVSLNARRAAEEARGTVRWLRPDFQNPAARAAAPGELEVEVELEGESAAPAAPRVRPWPAELPAQVREVAEVLAAARAPLSEVAIAAHFKSRGKWRARLPLVLSTLEAVGRVRATASGEWLAA